MARQFRERRFVWLALWFVLGGAGVIEAFMGLDSLGAALSADVNAKPSGVGRFLIEVGPYCLLGVVACCLKRVQARAVVMILAHVAVIGIGAVVGLPKFGLSKSLMHGLVISGVLLIPFGIAWVILLMDFLPAPRGVVRVSN